MECDIAKIKEFLNENRFDVTYWGNEDVIITNFCSLINPKPSCLLWVKSADKNALDGLVQDDYIIVSKEIMPIKTDRVFFILTNEPKKVFFALLDYFFDDAAMLPPVGENTFIGADVAIGENTKIGNNCSIDGKISIGNNVVISDNVVIKNKVSIGNRCVIQSSVIIGEDGFGYTEDENHVKTMIKHHGGVQIGDDVFIGNHTNISRGTIDDTIIGKGSKIAPSSHIGHNNKWGENVAFICSKSYGSVQIGENAYIVGSVINNQVVVEKDALIGVGSAVTKKVEENKVAVGIPAKVIRDRY